MQHVKKAHSLQELEHYRSTEETLINNLDYKETVLELADKLLPFVKADIAAGDMEKLLEKFAPIGFLKMAELAVKANNERTQLAAAIALVDRAGYRPVERSINLEGDLSKMAPGQLDSFLKNAWGRIPEEDKAKFVNLIKAPDGTYTVPDEHEVPNVLKTEVPEEEY